MIAQVITIGKPRAMQKWLTALSQPRFFVAWMVKRPEGMTLFGRDQVTRPRLAPPPGTNVYVAHNGDDPRKHLTINVDAIIGVLS